jgi:hypothetical protein
VIGGKMPRRKRFPFNPRMQNLFTHHAIEFGNISEEKRKDWEEI